MINVELRIPIAKAWGPMREGSRREGILLHYDASRSDVGAVNWLVNDRRVEVSYHYLVLDDGRILQIAPPGTRAWHAGVCKPSSPRFHYRDGNDAFYGLAIAATDGDTVTLRQMDSLVALCRYLYWLEGWPSTDTWRITGHCDEAWPRGRKVDPVGSDPNNPVLSVDHVRHQFSLARTP